MKNCAIIKNIKLCIDKLKCKILAQGPHKLSRIVKLNHAPKVSLRSVERRSIHGENYAISRRNCTNLCSRKSRTRNELTKKYIPRLKFREPDYKVGQLGADLLARQETMPFYIQVANPRCYRGLPMSPCLFCLPSSSSR